MLLPVTDIALALHPSCHFVLFVVNDLAVNGAFRMYWPDLNQEDHEEKQVNSVRWTETTG